MTRVHTYKVVQHITKVIADDIPSHEEALYCLEIHSSQGLSNLEVIENPLPAITGMGRDPDLHHS